VSWTGGASRCPCGATSGANTPWLRSYVRSPPGLRWGLDGVVSAVSARPAGHAVRGFVVELLVRASRLEQRWAEAEQRAAVMGHHGTPQLT
jgi:hypothetical protein